MKKLVIIAVLVGAMSFGLGGCLATNTNKDTTPETKIEKQVEEPAQVEEPTETPIQNVEEPAQVVETPSVPLEWSNCLENAKSYNKSCHMSYEDLKHQLLDYEKFSEEAVNYAMENVNADYGLNALETAQSYVNHSHFSETGLRDQMVYEKFTDVEIDYAMNNVQVDYMQEAKESAESYNKTCHMSHDELYNQLIYEEFTPEQATYGVQCVYGY